MRKLREARHRESAEVKPGLKVDVVGADVALANKHVRIEFRENLQQYALKLIKNRQEPFKKGDKLIAASTEGTVLISRNGKNKRIRIYD